ncbi:hypothetical protein SEVIR_3G228700v4 [Setaria viridis]|uniref:CBM20 domain-containing protein n=1 Tax=Setaria viridis TaxID=4556 RepID=A0A4U6VG92_SETVI|nr:phosphoglucan, water dikinase, chloroplastic-like [Setaria viridis]TKW27003.1 hypothetical protein SEVIR_3G228700v2 [Setaria viridis]
MESATAAVRGPGASLARAALVCPGRARGRGPRRVVGGGLAAPAPGPRRRALVAVASLQEPLPSRAQEGPVVVAPPQADEEEVHGNGAAAVETSSPPAVSGKTVRVRFVLEKQCAVDQSVYLVGDDPALGLWDPANAIPLECAESHGWILEKDLPANKLIEFKFLLRDSSGKLHWQNGPNRIFQTGEAANTLVVYEDWCDVKNQRIAEEEVVASVVMEEAVVSDDSESRQDTVIEDELQMDDNQEVKEDEPAVDEEEEKSAVNVSVQVDTLKINEGQPHESMLQKELEIIDELHETVDMEDVSALCADESSAEKTEEDNILPEHGVPVENGLASAYEHDLLWGWKVVQQLLMKLGIRMDTT